jgi:hypothetical protein
MSITKFTIYGERCSGTNFLEKAITTNYNLPVTWEYGRKHWWGFRPLEKEDTSNVLFIGIAKSLRDWIHSFLYRPHHIPKKLQQVKKYWARQIYSIDESKKEMTHDRNIYTGKRYRNLFELYRVKHEVLLNIIPKQVKNFIFIHYSDLNTHYAETLGMVEERFGLAPLRKSPSFIPILTYKGGCGNPKTSNTRGKPRVIPDSKLAVYIRVNGMEKIMKHIESCRIFR